MTDRVYPSSKPKPTTKTTTTTTTPNQKLPPPPNKSQLPTTTTNRHPYRPNPTTITTHHRRNRRNRCFCLCCFWSILILLLLLLITTISGCILYLLYHPHRPNFSIAALKTTTFTLSTTSSDDTTHLTTTLNLTLSISNPNNKKITFFYDPFTITLLSHDTLIANGSYPLPITSKPNNITIIHSPLHTTSLLLDPDTVRLIKSDLNKKSGLPMKLLLDTEAKLKVETLTTKKVGIRIICQGIHSLVPKHSRRNMTSSSAVAASVTAAKCKVDLRIKIWKWTF